MKRRPDTVRVEAEGIGAFDRFTSLAISYDLTAPSEASFEVGDDGSWKELERFVKPGTKYRVYINNALKLTGKAILNDVPIDERGSVVRFSVRTKLADAMYASADPKTRVSGTSVKDFVLALYAPLGYGPGDFVFDADVSRNLLTGVSRTGAKPPPEFESMIENKAKVQPPEAIYAAADKHLRRFGLMHWDSPDGKIVVGAPDDEQMPLYHFRMVNGPGGYANNLLSAQFVRDWSELPSVLGVFGRLGEGGLSQVPVRHVISDQEVIDAGFYRPVLVIQEGVTSEALAARAAFRERTARNKNRQTWVLTTDGFSYWDKNQIISYGTDTVCEITTTSAASPNGAYLIHRVAHTRDAERGDVTQLFALARGLWRL
jgi:prophage tail gpP-like protein